LYEVPEIKATALKHIPQEIQSMHGTEQVIELLQWFKHRFFKWVDQPPCDQCGGSTKSVGGAQPSVEEQRWQGFRVELYVCEACQAFTRFPRYNHPLKLLETRRGRCGEWANCFTLCCRALNLDARYILDFTDHVWTEVYDTETHRWVHCDCCEAQYDRPLTYEAGWGKKLNYVFALAYDHVVDVIPRYTRLWDAVKSRRDLISEDLLQNLIVSINESIVPKLPSARRAIVQQRLSEERIELENYLKGAVPTVIRADETQGRQSGSEEWRSQRGELGQGKAEICAVPTTALTKPTTSSPSLLHSQEVIKMESENANNNAQLDKFVLVGNAAGDRNNSTIIITPNATGQRGGAWFADLVDISKGFTVRMKIKMSTRGADGMAFVIQRSQRGTAALGTDGCGIGYEGISRSIAIELDTWQTVDRCNDPSNNHISIHTRGTLPNSSHHSHSLACVDPPFLLNDGVAHVIEIQYDAEKKFVDVWGDGLPILEAKADVLQLLNLEDGKVWFGVVGATGGIGQVHELLSFSVNIGE